MTTCTISPADFEKALARACVRAVTRAVRSEPLRGGDLTAVEYGPVIADIADEADLSVPQTRRRLQAMQAEGKVIRDDRRRGGSTAWWLVGLAETLRPHGEPTVLLTPCAPMPGAIYAAHRECRPTSDAQLSTEAAKVRQGFTARQHWSDVLGVARDCSTSDARQAFTAAVGAVPEHDLDAEQQRQRIRDAYNARLTEDGISEYERP